MICMVEHRSRERERAKRGDKFSAQLLLLPVFESVAAVRIVRACVCVCVTINELGTEREREKKNA